MGKRSVERTVERRRGVWPRMTRWPDLPMTRSSSVPPCLRGRCSYFLSKTNGHFAARFYHFLESYVFQLGTELFGFLLQSGSPNPEHVYICYSLPPNPTGETER